MAEHDIDELLHLLDERPTPDPTFDQRLRARLRAELAGAATDDAVAAATPTEEVFEVDTVNTPPIRRPRWLPAAATAAAVAVAVVAGAIVIADDDEGSSRVANAPDTTFAGATIDETALDIDGMPFFVGAGEHVWVLSLAGGLHEVDDGVVTAAGTTIHEASTMAVDSNAVWIADAGSGDVLRLDPDTGDLVERIPTGVEVRSTFRIPMLEGTSRPFADVGGIAADGTSVWIGDLAGEVLHIDPATNEVDRRLPVPVRPEVLRVDGDRLLAVSLGTGEVAVIDTDGELVHSTADEDLVGAALDDGVLYLQDGSDGTITRVDLDSGTEVTSAPLGRSFSQTGVPMRAPMPVVSDAGLLVDVAGDGGAVRVLDPVTLEQLDALDVEDGHGDLVLDPDGSAWLVRARDGVLVHLTPVRGGDD